MTDHLPVISKSDGRVSTEPTLESDDTQCPTECEARDGNSDVEEHHYIVAAPAHRGERDFLSAENKNEAAACEEEAAHCLSRGTGGKDGTRR